MMKHTTLHQLNSNDYRNLHSLYNELKVISLEDPYSIKHIVALSKQAHQLILGLPDNEKSLAILQKVYALEDRFLKSPSSSIQLNKNMHFNIQRYAMDAIYEMM